jgi:hypothetical protein
MADRSVKFNSFILRGLNFPCMNFDSAITMVFLGDFLVNQLILLI